MQDTPHPLASGVKKTKESPFVRVLPGGDLSIAVVLLSPGLDPPHQAVSKLPRPTSARPDVYCPFCGRKGHYSLTDKYHHFSHSDGQQECVEHDLETALHLRAKHLLLHQLSLARTHRKSITARLPCVRCGNAFQKKVVARTTWDLEEAERTLANGLRPDVLLSLDGAPVFAVEVFVTHAVASEKGARYVADGLAGVEIAAKDLFNEQGQPTWSYPVPLPLPLSAWGLEVAPRTMNICSSCRGITKELRNTAKLTAALALDDPSAWAEILASGGFSPAWRLELANRPHDAVLDVTHAPEVFRERLPHERSISPDDLNSKIFAGLRGRYGETSLKFWSSLPEIAYTLFAPVVERLSELIGDISGQTDAMDDDGDAISGALEIAEFVHHAIGSAEVQHRSRGWIGYALLSSAHRWGNTCMDERRLRSWPGKKLRGFSDEQLARWLEMLEKQRFIARFRDGNTPLVALFGLAVRERGIAFGLSKLLIGKRPRLRSISSSALDGLNDAQKRAVRAVYSTPITIIHGAAGTGKSRVIAGFLRALPSLSWLILAPTGKAADRLREVTDGNPNCGLPMTFARLLRDPFGDFQLAHDAPIGVVLDEAGFISVEDFAKLLEVLGRMEIARLVLVGDPMQLPSIGPGRVLHDLIEWSRDPRRGISQVALTDIMRSNSAIAAAAGAIRDGRFPPTSDAITIEDPASDEDDFVAQVVKTFEDLSCQSLGPVQIISKRRDDVRRLNLAIQQHQNPRGKPLDAAPGLRVGDRVICNQNYYGDITLLNGQQVEVVGETAENLLLGAEPVPISLPIAEAGRLDLGYALTIHKAQGSEWDSVIITLPPGNKATSGARPLIYTALTRGRSRVHIVSRRETLSQAIRANLSRRTSLRYFLRQHWK
jgi:hypothetical protein